MGHWTSTHPVCCENVVLTHCPLTGMFIPYDGRFLLPRGTAAYDV